MSRRALLPVLVLLAGAGVIAWIVLSYHPAPPVPRDADHREATAPSGCLRCHGPGGSRQRPPSHPISEACFSCHRWG